MSRTSTSMMQACLPFSLLAAIVFVGAAACGSDNSSASAPAHHERPAEIVPEGVPRCDDGHPLKPDVVLFGELLPERALERAYDLASSADVLLCVGSSLEVHPVAQLPGVTQINGGAVALVTTGPTPWDTRAVAKLDGDVVEELEGLLLALDGLGAV